MEREKEHKESEEQQRIFVKDYEKKRQKKYEKQYIEDLLFEEEMDLDEDDFLW